MLARESLKVSARFMEDVIRVQALTVLGHHAQSRALFDQLVRRAEADLPVLRGVISQLDAADGPDAPKRGFTDRFGRVCPPRPDLHATNDDHPVTPELPATPVA